MNPLWCTYCCTKSVWYIQQLPLSVEYLSTPSIFRYSLSSSFGILFVILQVSIKPHTKFQRFLNSIGSNALSNMAIPSDDVTRLNLSQHPWPPFIRTPTPEISCKAVQSYVESTGSHNTTNAASCNHTAYCFTISSRDSVIDADPEIPVNIGRLLAILAQKRLQSNSVLNWKEEAYYNRDTQLIITGIQRSCFKRNHYNG